MLLNRSMLGPSVVAVALFSGSLQAQAALTTFESDSIFTSTSGFTKVGGANVRWGNGAASGDWEYAVVNANDIPLTPSGQGQLATPALPGYVASSDSVANMQFTFSYTAAGLLSLSLRDINDIAVGDKGTVFGNVTPNPAVNALVLRAKIGAGDYAVIGPGSSTSGNPGDAGVQGLRVNFTSGGSADLFRLVGDLDAQYLMLTDSRLAGGFTINDTATLRDGSGSVPMWQFKLGTVSAVPVPASLPLLAAGLGVMVWLGRRHRQSVAWA